MLFYIIRPIDLAMVPVYETRSICNAPVAGGPPFLIPLMGRGKGGGRGEEAIYRLSIWVP
jgi:hypothetical protein